MDLLRKYMLSTAMLRSPDEPAAGDPPASDPVVVDPAAAAGDPPAGDPPAADPPRNQPPKWALDRISAETARREAAEQRAAEEAQRREAAEALAARLQAGRSDGDNPPAREPAPSRTEPPANIESLVNAEANRRELNRESTAIRSAGMSEFGASFGDTLSVLNAVGAVSDDIVLDLVAVDRANSHKILTQLAKDPEKAAAFAQLDSRRRIAELTRMSDALKTAPAPAVDPKASPAPAKTVSKAPAPPPPVDPSAVKSVDWRDDKTSDAEFSKAWDENFKKRSARR